MSWIGYKSARKERWEVASQESRARQPRPCAFAAQVQRWQAAALTDHCLPTACPPPARTWLAAAKHRRLRRLNCHHLNRGLLRMR